MNSISLRVMKILFILTTIGVFVACVAVGVWSAFSHIHVTNAEASVLIIPCISAVVAVVKAKHLFEDPEAVIKLRAEYSESEARLKLQHADAVIQLKSEAHEAQLRHVAKMAELERKHELAESKWNEERMELMMRAGLRAH